MIAPFVYIVDITASGTILNEYVQISQADRSWRDVDWDKGSYTFPCNRQWGNTSRSVVNKDVEPNSM